MMKGRGGNWNRGGRRGGGARPVEIRVGINSMSAGLAIVSRLCLLDRHDLCADVRAPGTCACECHDAPKGPVA